MELRDALRMLRLEAGLTQNEFASAIYVSFSTVNRWENQKMRPNRMQSKEILNFAKQHHVSTACLEALSECLLAPRMDDTKDKERMKQSDEQMKLVQRNFLTAEQFRKTMDNIDMALIGQRFYDRNPASCDVFYYNGYFAKSFGYPPKAFEARLHAEPFFAIVPECQLALLQQLGDLLSHNIEPQDFSLIVKAVRKDGTVFWLEVKAASLTEYSYGQEVFTSCRDVTQQVEAERRYKEEVLLRDISMQVMFANLHCDLTENRISRSYHLPAVTGKAYNGETIDQVIRMIADAAPENAEKERFLNTLNREALLRAYESGEVYGNVVLYNQHIRRWFRNEYLVVQNPASGNIHALLYMLDMQKQVLSESMLGIFFEKFFDFVALIDVEAETIESYYLAQDVFGGGNPGKRLYQSACDDAFALRGYAETKDGERNAVALRTVRDRLEQSEFYSTVVHLRGDDQAPMEKKLTYTYLDGNRNMIIMAQSDIHALLRLMQRHKALYGTSNEPT